MAAPVIRKAARQQAKIRLAYSGTSGSGKTTSALMTAFGLVGDWDKVGFVDSENRSADLYANFTVPGTRFTIGEFQKIDIDAPFTPERYIESIRAFEAAGVEVVVIDSISHEWEGKGGCLEIHERLGGQFKHWSEVTPRHRAFIDAILQSKCHVITCARAKTDYAMSTDNGKTKVEKVGLKDVTREGFDYEVTADLDLDILHNARASKDRTGLFMGSPAFIPSVDTGKALKSWCEAGDPVVAPSPARSGTGEGQSSPPAPGVVPEVLTEAIKEINSAATQDELDDVVAKYKGQFNHDQKKQVGAAWNARKKSLEGGS